MYIIDISNPDQASIVGTWNYGPIGAVSVSNSYAYVIVSRSSFYVIDISNPQIPYAVGYYNSNGFFDTFTDILYISPYVIVANGATTWGTSGFKVIDVSYPTAPMVT